MKRRMARDKRSEGGFITLDFAFAIMVSFGFTIILFSIAVTLALVEAAQYVTYATSRAYAGAHETEQAQQDAAVAKFNEIMERPAFKTLLGQSWMKLGPPQLGDFYSDYPNPGGGDDNTFVGARVPLDAKLLQMKIPFMGKMAEDSGVGKAVLNSYLMREVSTTECRENFNRARFNNIKQLGGGYGSANGDAKLITDNGC